MNKHSGLLSLFVSVLSLLVAGNLRALDRPGDNAGIAIDQIGVLAYPTSMLYQAIDSGEVRIIISVDADGKLTDCLVTGYTHEDFAKSAVVAIKRWKYQPAMSHGEARSARAEVLFQFRDHGVIVQSLPGAMERRMVTRSIGEPYVYAPCRLRDLDQTPTPDQVLVTPAIKGDAKTHKVSVEFYIDEEGRTRMPAVDRGSADDLYAAAAVVAVEQWRFKPPLRKGRPVLVHAQQEFTFFPADATPPARAPAAASSRPPG